MPRVKAADPEVAKENARKLAARKARQAHQAIEGVAAMAEYRRAADERLNRMARLREVRLKHEARGLKSATGDTARPSTDGFERTPTPNQTMFGPKLLPFTACREQAEVARDAHTRALLTEMPAAGAAWNSPRRSKLKCINGGDLT